MNGRVKIPTLFDVPVMVVNPPIGTRRAGTTTGTKVPNEMIELHDERKGHMTPVIGLLVNVKNIRYVELATTWII